MSLRFEVALGRGTEVDLTISNELHTGSDTLDQKGSPAPDGPAGPRSDLTISSMDASTRLITAAHAAELTAPAMSVYTHLRLRQHFLLQSSPSSSLIRHEARKGRWSSGPGRHALPVDVRRRHSPLGALGKLSIHATGPGAQPAGSQNTGCLRYHHTSTSWAPVVVIQIREENLVPKDDLADVKVLSKRQ